MTEAKWTDGPFTIRQPDKWPWEIITMDKNDHVVWSEDRMAYSTRQKSLRDVMDGVGMGSYEEQEEARQMNEQQLADAYLRAAAPELADEHQKDLERLAEIGEHIAKGRLTHAISSITDMGNIKHALLAKANGEHQ